ncbi:MAG: SH3 domain-containing protein [Chloroflexi bacterium]|nr:SH3 domain-containing protein [Chloroflexota bacterium]
MARKSIPILLLVLLFTHIAAAQNAFPLMTAFQDAILYAGPGDSHVQIRWLPAGVPVEARERNSIGNWLFVSTPDDGIRGWVPTGYLNANPDLHLSEIPIIPKFPTATRQIERRHWRRCTLRRSSAR